MRKILSIVLVLAGLAGVATLLIGKGEEAIPAVKPVIGPAVQAVYATGTAEPSVMIPIAPRTTARLIQLLADEGAKVEKNQVLAQLEDTDLQRELDELTARAEFATKDYTRKAELVKRGAVSKESADQSKADLDAAKASVERVKAQLGFLKLVAPESGTVIRRDGEVGELIAANDPVFWISCCQPMRVAAEVDEEDISMVEAGQKVIIRADAFPGKIMEGKVTSITPKGDAIARSYRVRVGLNDDTPLMTGMTAETNIIISEKKEALLVPAGAVRNNAVWIVKDGQLEKREVVVGAESAESVEIRSGVTTDDLIVSDFSADFDPAKKYTINIENWAP